jgi:hypothetical protein
LVHDTCSQIKGEKVFLVNHDGLKHTIYESEGDSKQPNKDSPPILDEWLESDPEFTAALERLRDVQKDDPFKTRTEEDTYVNSMMIVLLLFETRDRHYKSSNS